MTDGGVGGNITGMYEPAFENTDSSRLPPLPERIHRVENPRPLPRLEGYPYERKEGITPLEAVIIILIIGFGVFGSIAVWKFVQAIDDGKVGNIDQDIKSEFFQNTTNNYDLNTENTFNNEFNQTFVFHFYMKDFNFSTTS